MELDEEEEETEVVEEGDVLFNKFMLALLLLFSLRLWLQLFMITSSRVCTKSSWLEYGVFEVVVVFWLELLDDPAEDEDEDDEAVDEEEEDEEEFG